MSRPLALAAAAVLERLAELETGTSRFTCYVQPAGAPFEIPAGHGTRARDVFELARSRFPDVDVSRFRVIERLTEYPFTVLRTVTSAELGYSVRVPDVAPVDNPALDESGARFARDIAESSIVARVALQGYGAGWPDGHVATAIRSMNESGRLESLATGRPSSYSVAVPDGYGQNPDGSLYELGTVPSADAMRAEGLSPDTGRPYFECSHGYTADCPDCDVPSYWPSVLDGHDSADTEGV